MPKRLTNPFNPQKLLRWESFLVVLILFEVVVFGAINPRFLRLPVLFGSFNDFTSICIISIFVTFVLITGGMDIQSGSIVGLSSIVLGVTWASSGLNIWLVVVFTIITGALCGAFSGFLVAFTQVPSMVVTLGCSFLYTGFAKTIMKIAKIETHKGISNFPASFTAFTGWSIGGVPFQFIIFVILAITAHVLLHRTKYGRYVFLCGINQNAAEYSGINSRFIVMSTYIISGMGASLAGIILTSYLGTAKPDFGKELTLPIITAVVLGGTSIFGGKGTIVGTALAALAIGVMRFGLSMSGISTQYLDIPVGFLLIIAVGLRALSGNWGEVKKLFYRAKPAFSRSK
ncbi:MAG: ABC transporter permease [Spirochaetaceae bacterium]|jgi:AI-2 transport system permease protein|nr:ABC transporter permease [Spirochaetaceae bacterium]